MNWNASYRGNPKEQINGYQITTYTVIDNKEYQGRQSHNLTRVLKTSNGKKLRICIKRDSYDFQSYARIELWSEPEGKWNYVHNIPYPEMACVQSALGGKMEEDARELLRMALLIIE